VTDQPPVPTSPLLIRDRLSASVGMNVFFGRLVVERNEARFDPVGFGNKLDVDAAPTIHHTDRAVTVVF
jgi:hypothetical protein